MCERAVRRSNRDVDEREKPDDESATKHAHADTVTRRAERVKADRGEPR